MAKSEGSPRGETLVFDTPEEGKQFTERTQEKLRQQEGQPDVRRDKEIVGEEVAAEFAKEGEGVELVKHPWEHTREEHEEVQQLVNVAFEKNLKAAIGKARDSQHYPRNLDLFHDVLTTEMYQQVVDHDLNEQPIGLRVIVAGSAVVLVLLIIVLMFAL